MPKISSELTNKTVENTPKMRSFEVPDETGFSEPEINFDEMDALMASRGLPPLTEDMKRAMAARKATMTNTMPKQVEATSSFNNPKELAQFEEQISQARKARLSGKERLSPGAKNRIEALVGVSRGSKNVDIDGNIFSLTTIKGKEQRDSLSTALEFDGTVHYMFEIRRQLLARAIKQISGTDLGLFLGDDSIDAKLAFVDEIDEPVLIKLYNEYLNLVEQSQNKYMPRTDKEAEGVLDDLKK